MPYEKVLIDICPICEEPITWISTKEGPVPYCKCYERD